MVKSDPETTTTKRVTFCLSEQESISSGFDTSSDNEVLSAPEFDSPVVRRSPHRMNDRGSYGNKSSPNKLPSKSKRRVPRDTLNGRMRKRKGKPGSRKYHRWQNEKILGRRDELSDTGPDDDEEMELYLFDSSSQNIFYQMFEDPSLHAAWQPFLDITEEEEKILRSFVDSDDDSDSSDESPAYRHEFYSRSHIAFQRLTADGRKSINKYAQTDFLADLDHVIFSFVNQQYSDSMTSDYFTSRVCPTSQKLILKMKDSHHRLMAHSVSTFYNATSVSQFNSSGIKVVMVAPPEKLKRTPNQSLVSYLLQSIDVSYWTSTKAPRKRCAFSAVRRDDLSLANFSNEANVGWV
uniref:R3H-associated N-terminal domain-containing protein n=1 Tax=Vannella robusta TaxID=1487602 RepID=A0A7S4HUU5_9EUKA